MVFICINVARMQTRFRNRTLATPILLITLFLAACGESTTETTATSSSTAATTTTAASARELAEVSSLSPRIVLAHDKGITVIDAATGETINETGRGGFLRLNSAGDGRHVLITDGDRFLAYDAAVKSRVHGDHAHHYAGEPGLSEISYDSPHAGHVVVNDGLTALFSDGDGTVRIVPTDEVAEGYRAAEGVTVNSGAPHHGVAVPFRDGSVLITVGTEKERDTIEYRSAAGEVLAQTRDCPGIHGEAVGAGGVTVFGCTNGPVVFDGHEFHKITPSEGVTYQRSGNLAGHPDSPVILGDHKVIEDAEHERPTKINLIDTRDNTMTQVELDSSYWFRSLARGPEGEALVLTYDGHLKVIDPETGEITNDIPAIEAWQEKSEWQEPGPILKVLGDTAYVTDAEKRELALIDLTTGDVKDRITLDHAPVELAVVDGVADADAEQLGGGHGDHEGHEGHDH